MRAVLAGLYIQLAICWEMWQNKDLQTVIEEAHETLFS